MLKIGTLNCRGINYQLKETMIATDFEEYKIDILTLQETHIRGTGVKEISTIKGKKYTLHYSGLSETSKEKNFSGVGIIIKDNLNGKFKPISERICCMEFQTDNIKWVVICAYAYTLPISEKNPEKKHKFYDDLEKIIKSYGVQYNIIIAGDFNAKTGSAHKIFCRNIGKFAKEN